MEKLKSNNFLGKQNDEMKHQEQKIMGYPCQLLYLLQSLNKLLKYSELPCNSL